MNATSVRSSKRRSLKKSYITHNFEDHLHGNCFNPQAMKRAMLLLTGRIWEECCKWKAQITVKSPVCTYCTKNTGNHVTLLLFVKEKWLHILKANLSWSVSTESNLLQIPFLTFDVSSSWKNRPFVLQKNICDRDGQKTLLWNKRSAN